MTNTQPVGAVDQATVRAFQELVSAPAPNPGPRMMSTKASQITPSRPVWLWERWLTAGALHILVGRQGFGKSTFAAWLTAQCTTGRPYPDDEVVREPVNVATLSLEEAADRLVARLHAAGADVGRVDVLADVEDEDIDGRAFRRPWRLPNDCGVLESFIRDNRIRLLVVDGLGYSIQGDSHNYAVVGSALSALAGVAERTGCAVLGLTHPPKGGSDPVTAAIGSTAWTAIPRVVWVLGADPEDDTESRRVCRVSKTNYQAPANGISFSIGNDGIYECGFVTGLSTSTVSAEVLMAARQTDDERTQRDEARELLRSLLQDGPMETSAVSKIAHDAGLSDRTLTRARGDLRIETSARHDPKTGRLSGWMLSLPNHGANANVPASQPVGQPLTGAQGALVLTREYIETPVGQREHIGGALGPLAPTRENTIESPPVRHQSPSGPVDEAPPPDDSMFLADEDGFS